MKQFQNITIMSITSKDDLKQSIESELRKQSHKIVFWHHHPWFFQVQILGKRNRLSIKLVEELFEHKASFLRFFYFVKYNNIWIVQTVWTWEKYKCFQSTWSCAHILPNQLSDFSRYFRSPGLNQDKENHNLTSSPSSSTITQETISGLSVISKLFS